MYPEASLARNYYEHYTNGTLTLPSGQQLKTLERPWLDNKKNVSCFPEGEYLVKWLPRSASGKYKRVWHVQDVPERSGILIHNGNLIIHSYGCPLVGLSHGQLYGKPAVLSSLSALNRMRRELGGKDFILKVSSI